MIASIGKLRTANDAAQRAQLVASVNGSFALDVLSRQALGAQWNKLKSAQRAHFTDLLKQLLEKLAYPRAAEFFATLEVDYGRETVKDGQRIVPTKVKRAGAGAVAIDYVLSNRGGRWRVVDIILDGQSLAQSVSGQIQAVLKQGSFAGLVEQMEARLKQPVS